MGRHREPWSKTRLKNEPSAISRGRQRNHHVIERVENEIGPLDVDAGIAAVDDLQTADEWYRRIGDVMRGVGVLRASDEAIVMMLSHALERYGRLHRVYRSCDLDDPDALDRWHGRVHKETMLILKLSDRIGLNPSSRSKFIVEAAASSLMGAQAAKVRGFNFDG